MFLARARYFQANIARCGLRLVHTLFHLPSCKYWPYVLGKLRGPVERPTKVRSVDVLDLGTIESISGFPIAQADGVGPTDAGSFPTKRICSCGWIE